MACTRQAPVLTKPTSAQRRPVQDACREAFKPYRGASCFRKQFWRKRGRCKMHIRNCFGALGSQCGFFGLPLPYHFLPPLVSAKPVAPQMGPVRGASWEPVSCYRMSVSLLDHPHALPLEAGIGFEENSFGERGAGARCISGIALGVWDRSVVFLGPPGLTIFSRRGF